MARPVRIPTPSASRHSGRAFGDTATMRAQTKVLWLACVVAATVGQAGSGANAAQTFIVMEDIPLSCAISNLAQQASLNYILDPRASSGSVGPAKWIMPQRTVTCRWTNGAPELALKQLLREQSLKMVTNAVTSVTRIVSVFQFVEPIPASEVGNETTSVVPVVDLENAPLATVIDELGKRADLKISVDPGLPIPTSGPPELTIGTSIVSVHWQNIRPRQALFALLDACDLTMTEQPATSSATIIIKPRALDSRRQPNEGLKK